MTREEFINVLDAKGYSYKIEGDKIIVNRKGVINLRDLTSLPPGVVFRNEGHIFLSSLTSLPPGVEFMNGGYVFLYSLTSLPPGVEFRNEGYVRLVSLIGGDFNQWDNNIEGIDSNMLLNLMISKGIFI
jgi:hypothetical protein